MPGKCLLLQFFTLLLVSFACTAKKTALNQYFEGVTWEGVNTSRDEIKINNCRYQYKGDLGTAATRLKMIDDKRLTMTHEDADTFFVSILNLAEKNFLVLHDSSFLMQYFKSDQFNGQPALDNHDKIDLNFLNLGVSIGQPMPIESLKDIQEYPLDLLQNSGAKRRGQIVNAEEVFVNLSSDNRVLGITQHRSTQEDISTLVDKLTKQLGFPPNQKKLRLPNKGFYMEQEFEWKLIGLNISLYANRYRDNEKNQKLGVAGKRFGTLTISDLFLNEVEIFKANFLNQN